MSIGHGQRESTRPGRVDDALVQLRRHGTISNETMNRVIREPDLEESPLEI
jgi:hypothetical protein